MLNKVSLVLLILCISSVFELSRCQSQQCQKFVQQLISNIMKLNISSIPLPSIMYSGITTNNPGQFYQCQQQSNFSYYLVTIKNTTTNINSFTGICVPEQCSKEDMKIALDFWNCEVYDFESDDTDALATIGIVLLSVWVGVLVVWSVVISCREPEVNQYVKKEKEETTSVNSLVESVATDMDTSDIFKYHVFNYYQGYQKIFKKPKRKSLMGSFFFLAALSALITTQFSYKQAISSNPSKAYEFFNSFLGVFVTNIEVTFSVIMFILGMKLSYGVYKFVTFHEIGRFFFDHLLKKWTFFFLITMIIYGIMSYTDQPLSKYWQTNFGQDCPAYIWQDWFLFRHFQLDGKVCLPWLWILQTQIFLTLISAPFIVIFRIRKDLGYLLMLLVCTISVVIGFAILDDQAILFAPTKLFNMQVQYNVNYQTNTFVRAGAFYFGVIFGFLVIQGLQKIEGKARTAQYKFAKKVKKQKTLQYALVIAGLIIMNVIYFSISSFLSIPQKAASQQSAYWFISLSPLIFLLGLAMFVLPSFWQVETGPSHLINKVFGWSGWSSFEKLSPSFLAVGPMVMGFTTFSSQNNIYYDGETIMVYLLGNLLLTYVFGLLVCAAIENQITFVFNFLQTKIFGKQNKYSILLLEE